jgi:YesN/AraC family two-component response regulator
VEKRLKVIVVDDEYLIRNLIRIRIDWEKNGLEIVGEAKDAKEAMTLLDIHKPDIVFTDICMPDKNGIEFSRMAFKKYPAIKIVIITGYDEFEYARESIKLGISDYILKPIRAQELLKTIEKLKKSIDRERTVLLKSEDLNVPAKLAVSTTKPGILVENIKAYMQDHMDDPTLNLQGVAEKFNMSAGHLGRMMKQETSETFVSCLTNIRIRRASELLKYTDMKSYMIGAQVGITDPHYFSILFKKTKGMSVSEFRKHAQNKQC